METKTGLLLVLFLVITAGNLAQENSEKANSQITKGTLFVVPQIQVIPIKDVKTERNFELHIQRKQSTARIRLKTVMSEEIQLLSCDLIDFSLVLQYRSSHK